MSLTDDEVRHVAKLASIQLTDEQVLKTKSQLNDILDYVNQLSNIDTRGVEPTSHVHGVVNAFRDDVVKESLPVESIEQNCPAFKNGCFVVPKII